MNNRQHMSVLCIYITLALYATTATQRNKCFCDEHRKKNAYNIS